MTKVFPQVGAKLYLSQSTGNPWVDSMKIPYTVIAVSNGKVVIQSAECIFKPGSHYSDMPTEIKADPNGEILILNWFPSKAKWGVDVHKSGFPSFATFTEKYVYFSYLD